MTFRHGVASGDPLPSSVILWTRWTPSTLDREHRADVDWLVARDPELHDVAARGTTTAGPDDGHTIKVDVGGLDPAATYWYRFGVGSVASRVGRTRTAPAPGAPVSSLRLGLVSCASYNYGWFNAYGNLARRDVDLVVHVGDYLYENGRQRRYGLHLGRVSTGPRHHPPDRATDLEGYRTRHALYKTDADLQALHARHPMVATWDDHELAGGTWSEGAEEHSSDRDGPWAHRLAAALKAYWEWMPVRQPDPSDPARIYRSLGWGDLADLLMLDTRLIGRERPPGKGRGILLSIRDTGRSILGVAQRGWFEQEVAASSARWRLLGNQVMMAPAAVARGHLVNPAQWDGYPMEREWLYGVLAAAGSNAVILSGDVHSSWAADLPVGAEMVSPSVSALSFGEILVPGGRAGSAAAARAFLAQGRHLKMVELRRHGYVVVDVTQERVQADWWHVLSVKKPSPDERPGGSWRLAVDSPGLVPAAGPLPPRRPGMG